MDKTLLKFKEQTDTFSLRTFQKSNGLSLSSYTDYREYLSDFYKLKRDQTKSDLRPYSYGTFSAAANIKSPNYLKLIIDGKRNLSDKMIPKFAKALGLNKADQDEFEVLVKYTQAKEPLERNQFLKGLNDIRVKSQIKQGGFSQEDFERVPSWVSWALVALTDTKTSNSNIDEIHSLLKGRASKREIKLCIEKLINQNQIEESEEGQLSKSSKQLKDAEKMPPELVRKLQAELMYLGLESLFHDEPRDREFGTITLSLTEKEYDQLKFDIRHFRKKIYNQALLDREQKGPGDRVFQLNFQLFPLTK